MKNWKPKKTDVSTEEIFKWDEILQEILESSDFQEQIRQNRYFQSPQNLNFRDWIKKRFGKTSRVNTASLLSLDFWNQQRPILRNKAYYLIRSGKGSFVIFDEKKFYSSYLNSEELKKAEVNAKTIDAFEPKGYEYLKKAFKENIVENTALEQLRFNGVYEKMIENVLGEKRQQNVGVRGNNSTFEVYFNNIDQLDVVYIYKHSGQTELDYTLWTEDSVFLFEAKKEKKNIYDKSLMLVWRKFAYAASRFKDYGDLNIYPVYFLRIPDKVILFVFPKFSFYKGNGVILNDVHHRPPERTYIVNIKN